MGGQSLVELFQKGGPVMWPLLFCSVVGLALILERSLIILWITTRFQPLVRSLKAYVKAGKYEQARQQLERSRSPVARVAAVYLEQLSSPPGLREEIVSRQASQEIAYLERRLNWLGTVAQVTPLLGLLGTVLGLMAAFQQVEIKGSQLQSADLAVGIWQKLMCTATGLMIAVPCLVAHYWLDNRVGTVALQMEWITSYLKEWLSQPVHASVNGTPRSEPAEIKLKPPVETVT